MNVLAKSYHFQYLYHKYVICRSFVIFYHFHKNDDMFEKPYDILQKYVKRKYTYCCLHKNSLLLFQFDKQFTIICLTSNEQQINHILAKPSPVHVYVRKKEQQLFIIANYHWIFYILCFSFRKKSCYVLGMMPLSHIF